MRKAENYDNFPWPKYPLEFKEIVRNVWNIQEQLGRELIGYLAIGMEVCVFKIKK